MRNEEKEYDRRTDLPDLPSPLSSWIFQSIHVETICGASCSLLTVNRKRSLLPFLDIIVVSN